MNVEYLEYIQRQLICIRDGILDDSSRTRAAYHLGVLLSSVNITLQEEKEIYESKKEI